MTPSDSGSTTPDSTDAADAGDVGDFPEVAGFSYRDLPGAVFQNLKSTIKGTPQVEDVQAKLVSKGGQEAGLVMRLAIDPETASVDGFEDGFLPGFAGGVAGSNAAPDYEDINGTNVVTVDVPGETGAAYAWLQGSVATVLVFKDAADAEAFAQAALG
ncbi:MAG: hypothetical protein ABI720_03525 [Actinomycetes bacterium]